MLTIQRLRSLLDYDPATGNLIWRVNKSGYAGAAKIGAVAGATNANGYIQVGIDRNLYMAHRLVWFHVHGRWPAKIDHKDGNSANNKLDNLRPASSSENGANSKLSRANLTGFKGVDRRKRDGRYRARVGFKHIGDFDTAEAAARAYDAEALKRYGEFARLNFPVVT